MFATGLTGFTVRSGSLGPELLAVGELTGAGRSNGSEVGFSAVVEVDFCVCLPVRRGRVLWPANTGVASNKTARTPRNCRIRVDLIMMASDCIRERVRFESSDSGLRETNLRMLGLRPSLLFLIACPSHVSVTARCRCKASTK